MRATSLGVFASRRKVLDDRDVIGVIRVKFPNSLTDKEIDTRDVTIVPDGKTSIGSYWGQDHDRYCIHTGVLFYPHADDGEAVRAEWKWCSAVPQGANALVNDGNISDGQLITISKQVFLTSGHKVSGVTDINIKWAKEDSAHKLSHSSTHRGTRVSQFGDLYNKELKVDETPPL